MPSTFGAGFNANLIYLIANEGAKWFGVAEVHGVRKESTSDRDCGPCRALRAGFCGNGDTGCARVMLKKPIIEKFEFYRVVVAECWHELLLNFLLGGHVIEHTTGEPKNQREQKQSDDFLDHESDRLTWRPRHLSTGEEMNMKVGNGFAAIFSVVDDKTEAARFFIDKPELLGNVARNE